MMKRSPWTTAAGVLTIAGAVLTFAGYWMSHGVPPGEAWAVLGTAVTMGAGLLKAADDKKDPPAPPQ